MPAVTVVFFKSAVIKWFNESYVKFIVDVSVNIEPTAFCADKSVPPTMLSIASCTFVAELVDDGL